MTPPRPHAKFEYELLTNHGAVVVLYLGLLSVLHKQRFGRGLFDGRAGFMEAADGLAEYFSKTHGRPTQIRKSNPKTLRRLAKFLVVMHDRFAAAVGGEIPEPLRAFREKLSPDKGLTEQLKGMKIEFSGRHSPIDFPLPDADHPDGNIIAALLRLATAASDKNPAHPDLPGILASDQFALATECLGLVEAHDDAAWKKTGLFCVIREARGPYTSEEKDINIIVRDVLWMRRSTGPDVSGQIRDNESGNIGYYFSTLDRTVYEIRNLLVRNGMMMLDAVSFMQKGGERSLCMYYPESANDHPLHCREGIIMGTTRDEKRSGAWKALIIRPDWPDLAALDAQLSVYLRRLEKRDRRNYADAIVKCFQFVSDNQLAGVLYSREWARNEKSPEMDATRTRFRTMLWETRAQARREHIFVGNRLDALLRAVLAPSVAKQSTGGERQLNAIIGAIQKVLTDNWQLIEPPQLISSGYTPDTSKAGAATKDALQDFTRREKVLDYEKYVAGLEVPSKKRRKR
jgi:hypothetical protein